MNKVFVLGAGASKDANIPLTNEIIPYLLKMKPNIAENPLRTSTASLSILQNYLMEIKKQPVLSCYDVEDLLLLTYSVIGYPELLGWDQNKIINFRHHLLWGIIFAIEPGLGLERNIEPYRYFVDSLTLNDAIITLNYDMLLDYLLIEKFGAINYHLDTALLSENNIPLHLQSGGFFFLKLHGSTNLFRCDRCNEYIILERPYAYLSEDPNLILANGKVPCPKDDGGNLWATLIAPSQEHEPIQMVFSTTWKKSYALLSNADDIYLIGLSFRENDFQFKHLLRASIASNLNCRISIINKTIDNPLRLRLKNMFIDREIDFIEMEFGKWVTNNQGLVRFY